MRPLSLAIALVGVSALEALVALIARVAAAPEAEAIFLGVAVVSAALGLGFLCVEAVAQVARR